MRRLRIAMLADYPPVQGQIDGGVQAASYYLVEALARTGDLELNVISFSSSASTASVEQHQGYRLYRLPRARFGTLTKWRRDAERLSSLLEQLEPDVVHAQGALSDGYLAVKGRWPSVVTIHGINSIDAKYESRFGKGLRLALTSKITEDFCVRNAHHIIAISPYVVETYGSILESKSRYIPNPTPAHFFQSDCKPIPGRVLFAGRLIPLKGVETLVRAFSDLRLESPMELRLAGSLDDKKYVRRLHQLAAELRVSNHVQFLGLLPESALIEEFTTADILVLPSFQENSPMVIQQAMACGLPVVATRVGGVPHVVADGVSGLLVKPGDAPAVAKAIREVTLFRPRRELMSGHAKAAAVAYCADSVARQTIEVYRRAATEQGAQRNQGI